MTKVREVCHRGYSASYSIEKPDPIDGISLKRLPAYRQQDYHSCGFLAALSVIHYFRPGIEDQEVLTAVKCAEGIGTSRSNIIKGLKKFGVSAVYCDDLNIPLLRIHMMMGTPVIISVWPDDWRVDHWTVVKGMDSEYVYLTNHYAVGFATFKREWIDNWGDEAALGCGLVCST